jgi:hypothetical protein
MVRKEMHIEFWLGKLKEGDYMEYLEVDGNVILRLVLKSKGERRLGSCDSE